MADERTLLSTIQNQPRTLASLSEEGNIGAQSLLGSRLATSAGESTPSMKFGQILMNMLIKAQQSVRPGIESLQSQQRGLQTEQAQRMATTPESLIGASPSMQSAARGASVSALEPSIQGAGNRIQTLSQQLAMANDVISQGRMIAQYMADEEKTSRKEKIDLFTKNPEAIQNLPDKEKSQWAKSMGVSNEFIDNYVAPIKAPETIETDQGIMQWDTATGQWTPTGLRKPSPQSTTPTSYNEWLLAGGLEKTGKTYAEFIATTKPSSQAEQTVAGYAARIEQAEPTINSVEENIVGMNPIAFNLTWDKSPTFQSNEMQQYMQAARNFINANLRRESGAVISPTEFEEARKQYLPQPGDSKETLELKKKNRNLVLASLKKAAGSAYSSVEELLGNNNDPLNIRQP